MSADEHLNGSQFKPGSSIEDEPVNHSEQAGKDLLKKIPTWDNDDELGAF